MFLRKNDYDRYYEFGSYAYKDDIREWYHAVDGTRKDFPPFTHEQIRRDKWNYTKKTLIELNVAKDVLKSDWPLKLLVVFLIKNPGFE